MSGEVTIKNNLNVNNNLTVNGTTTSNDISATKLTIQQPPAIQLGQDINGITIFNNSGNSISMNSAGDRVAIGSSKYGSHSGHVRVYEWNETSWTQLGPDINGEDTYGSFGYSVSMNSAGDRVAIGAILGNDVSGADSGHVRVFRYDQTNDTWTQLGVNIDGEAVDDKFGFSVSMNSAGDRVAIGAIFGTNNNNEKSGHVRVYQYDENINSWNPFGTNIDGETVDDQFGFSVSMNSAGDRVAIGVPNDGSGVNSDHVRVFQFYENNHTWQPLSDNIPSEAPGYQFGFSVSLSSDGNRVAIGAPKNSDNGLNSGQVRVYEWNNTSWTPLGVNINGEAEGDLSGYSVSINSAGDRVAIGATMNNGSVSDSGHVRVYQYIYNTWILLCDDINGEAQGDDFGSSVSMNSAGDRVAISAPGHDANGEDSGQVRIYQLNTGDNLTVNCKTILNSILTVNSATTLNNNLLFNDKAKLNSETDGTNGGSLVLHTKNDGGLLSEKIRINNKGAIGVGGTNYGTQGQVLVSSGSDGPVEWTSTLSDISATNLTVQNTATIDNLTVNGTDTNTLSNLTVTGTSILNDISANKLTVTGTDTNTLSNLNVDGTTTLNDISATKITVTGTDTNTLGDISATNLTVNSTTTLNDNLTVYGTTNTTKLTVTGTDTNTLSNLTVDGTATLNDNLQFDDKAKLNSEIEGTDGGSLVLHTKENGSLSEKIRINNKGAIGVGGNNYGTQGQVLTSNGSDASIEWTSTLSNLTVDGTTTLNDNLTVNGTTTINGQTIFNSSGDDPIVLFKRNNELVTWIDYDHTRFVTSLYANRLLLNFNGFETTHDGSRLGFDFVQANTTYMRACDSNTYRNTHEATASLRVLHLWAEQTVSAVSYATRSDDRFKHNEIHITNGLEIIKKLQPQFYDKSDNMKDENYNGVLEEGTYHKESGFIAQEVNEINELKHLVSIMKLWKTKFI